MSEGRAYGGESAETRSTRRRRQLLDAGRVVFGTTGFRKATVRQLCREARVNDRYFYEEFATTEDLLLSVYDECQLELRGAVTTAVAMLGTDAALDEVIRAGLQAFLSCIQDDPHIGRLLWFEVVGVNEKVDQRHMQRSREFGELIGLILEARGMRIAGQTPTGRSLLLTAIVGGINQVSMDWVAAGCLIKRADVVASLSTFIRNAIAVSPVG